MKIYYQCFLFFVLGIFFTTSAQNIKEDLKFKHFTSSDGLSQRSVMAILQDQKGYLWFGTRDGLNKFDGQNFTVYRHFTEDSTSLSHNSLHSIYEDSFGNLWIGTQNGLNKFNPAKENFTQYKNSKSAKSIANNIIWGITQLDNSLFVATNNGVSEINIKTDEIISYKNDSKTPNSLSNNSTRSFLKSNNGNLWIANITNIDIYNPTKNTFKRIEYPKKEGDKAFINDRPTLYQDIQNTIWLGYHNGLAKYDPILQIFTDYTFNTKKTITSAVRTICEDLSGNLWIGSYSGLYILDSEKKYLKHITQDENRANSLSQNSIYKIIRDSRGDMWLGTWAAGINYFNGDNQSFKEISFGKSDTSLNYKVVSGITEDEDGNLWIGTEGGGLNFLNRKTNTFEYFKNNPEQENCLTANNVKAVIKDKNDNIWVGIHDGGVNFLNPKKKPFQFQKIDFPKSSEYSLEGLKVLSLLEDKNGNIWIGTLTGGLILYDIKTSTLVKLDEDIRTVMCILESRNPNILLIGGDNGLESIHINTYKKTKINITDKRSKTQESLYVNSIFKDNFDNYWLGTEGQGAYMYNPKRKETKHFGMDEGLPSDIVYGILSDNNGNLWMSSNYGISRLNIQSNKIKNYTYSDGLQGNEFNYGSFFKTQKGELFFGGTNGLTYFNPSNIQENTFLPKVDIYNLEVNNAPFLRITDAISEVKLKHNQNDFSIEFAALSFMQSEKNQFAYILEGYDEDWHYVKNQRKVIYTNLDFGEYTFKVKAANNDGLWNTNGDTLKIEVSAPIWQTWWAYLLYSLGFVFLVFYIRKLLLLRVKDKKELKQERLEKEKIEEVNKMKLNLFTDVSHEFRTPLTLIIGPLERMINKKMGDAYVQEQHQIMNKNAKVLLQLINQILDFRKNDSGKLFLQASKNNIIPFIQDVKDSFKGLAQQKNVNYKFNTSKKNIEVWFDNIKLKKILFNLISNAFKFTKDNNDLFVNVYTTTKTENAKEIDYVVIDIINFVSVIPESHIKLIFERFYQLDDSKREMGSGIGLSLTKSLVELHKGHIEVNSSANEGTCFSVFLRLGKDHLSENDFLTESNTFDDKKFLDNLDIIQDLVHFENTQDLPVKAYNKELQSLLIVEDNVGLQNFIKDIFIDKYNIFVADNGEQGLTMAENNAIDLIISDVSMPIMDGFELCEKIKTTLITSHIPVILLTAKTSQTHQEKGYSIGANAYITKPFNATLLETRVDNLLQTRSSLIRKFKKDIILKPSELTITSTDELFLQKAIKVVEENITNPDFNTNFFIELMGMSRTVLYTKLKALTGQNLSTFIRIIKLKRAGQLIAQTDMSISQVAYEVGFNDLKYFRKCFKDFFKQLPSKYRENNSQKN
jgi:signal transduction histidine kinase/ligand-binding sensor domain-containing protein/AraC-like DNA-binding protein/FixJ family two-component response regulator